MVWGAFSALGTLRIAFTSPRMDSAEYIDVLQTNLVPYLRRFRRLKLVYQQDNAPIHRSNVTMQWFRQRRVELLEWPARSPDCNPMENVWAILVRRVYANNRQYGTVDELKAAIRQVWDELEPNILNNLILSMKKRMIALLKCNGGVINY